LESRNMTDWKQDESFDNQVDTSYTHTHGSDKNSKILVA